jgi:hypothetical protein
METARHQEFYLYLNAVVPHEPHPDPVWRSPTGVLKNCYKAFLISLDANVPGCVAFGKNAFLSRKETLDIDRVLSGFTQSLFNTYSFYVLNNTTMLRTQEDTTPLSDEDLRKLEEWLLSDEFAFPPSPLPALSATVRKTATDSVTASAALWNTGQEAATLVVFDPEN